MDSNNKLYVVIVTYNGEKWIRHCLQSVFASSILPYVIIVDNHSSDNTQQIVKQEFPQVELICSNENIGFGKANNIGIRKALGMKDARHIYLLNQDAWVYPNTFEILIEIMNRNLQFGICSPIQLNGKGNALDKNFLLNSSSPKFSPKFLNDLAMKSSLDEIYETSFVMAAHWLIRCSALLDVGLFSPAYPHYGEDTNLIQRFLYHGYKIGICPTCYACHDREDRILTPNGKIYKLYINHLVFYHNVLRLEQMRAYYTFKFMFQICTYRNVSIFQRFKTIKRMFKDIAESHSFRKIYMQKGCFIEK